MTIKAISHNSIIHFIVKHFTVIHCKKNRSFIGQLKFQYLNIINGPEISKAHLAQLLYNLKIKMRNNRWINDATTK